MYVITHCIVLESLEMSVIITDNIFAENNQYLFDFSFYISFSYLHKWSTVIYNTETALLSVVEDLRLARTASKSSLLILLDLSSDFDTVNHQILLSTLLRKGISGTALQWFDSYLSDRSFKVSWRGEVSKSQHLATVAQWLEHCVSSAKVVGLIPREHILRKNV